MINQGPIEDKLGFAFKLYDTDGNGILDPNEIDRLVRGIFKVSTNLAQHGVSSPQEMFEQMDQNGDGEITLPEFIEACKENPAIINAIDSALLSAIESTYLVEPISRIRDFNVSQFNLKQATSKDSATKLLATVVIRAC